MHVVQSLAPICLFTYNRLEETKSTLKALSENNLASSSDLIVYSDAPKSPEKAESVESVREFLRDISGFKSITIIEREENYGLAKSIIDGVTATLNQFGKVIVLEDDLITSKNFLDFMNKALFFYESQKKVWSVSGFSFPLNYHNDFSHDAVFGLRASSWGWATWSDRWNMVDWNVADYESFRSDAIAQERFKRGGSDLCKMLDDQMKGKINSWAIRFCYSQFRNECYDVYPRISKVENIGFSGNATNTKGMHKRFSTKLDNTNTTDFKFPCDVIIDEKLLAQFRKPFSIMTRLKYKLMRAFN